MTDIQCEILLNVTARAINGTFLSKVSFARMRKVTGRYIHDVALKKLISIIINDVQ